MPINDEDEPWDDDLDFPEGARGMIGKKESTALDWYNGSGKSTSTTKIVPRCYESHPAYEVAPGLFIYGGACGYPMVKDADIYGGFDWGMKKSDKGSYPWSPEQAGPVEFLFKITDMQAPTNPVEFKNMIVWLAEQLQAGKKVHIGCIGGHGRTGTVLAALHKHMTGEENATQHVRDHYCKKAVESTAQIQFLEKEWGIVPVAPTKTYTYGGSSKGGSGQKVLSFTEYGQDKLPGFDLEKKTKYHHDIPRSDRSSTGLPLHSENSIWG